MYYLLLFELVHIIHFDCSTAFIVSVFISFSFSFTIGSYAIYSFVKKMLKNNLEYGGNVLPKYLL